MKDKHGGDMGVTVRTNAKFVKEPSRGRII